MTLRHLLIYTTLALIVAAYGPDSITKNEFTVDADVAQSLWVGQVRTSTHFPLSPRTQRIWVRTTNNTVYKSFNSGGSWSSQMGMLPGSQEDLPDVAGATKWGVVQLIGGPGTSSLVVFLRGPGTRHWITKDGGQSYRLVASNVPLAIERLRFHPRRPNWALASVREQCSRPGKCCSTVYVTHDLGDTPTTWRKVAGGAQDFVWAEPPHSVRSDAPSPRVIVTASKTEGSDVFCGSWDANKDAMAFGDPWNTAVRQTMVPGGNTVEWAAGFLYVAARDTAGECSLFVSVDGTGSFSPARLPEKLPEKGYGILDASSGSVFLEVTHDHQSPWGHLYMSDSKGSGFTISKQHLHCSSPGRCDFAKVGGLDGVYIGNSVVNWAEAAVSGATLKSYVTFDQGAQWQLVTPPATDATGSPLQCSPCTAVLCTSMG